jgi:hypothetical protein
LAPSFACFSLFPFIFIWNFHWPLNQSVQSTICSYLWVFFRPYARHIRPDQYRLEKVLHFRKGRFGLATAFGWLAWHQSRLCEPGAGHRMLRCSDVPDVRSTYFEIFWWNNIYFLSNWIYLRKLGWKNVWSLSDILKTLACPLRHWCLSTVDGLDRRSPPSLKMQSSSLNLDRSSLVSCEIVGDRPCINVYDRLFCPTACLNSVRKCFPDPASGYPRWLLTSFSVFLIEIARSDDQMDIFRQAVARSAEPSQRTCLLPSDILISPCLSFLWLKRWSCISLGHPETRSDTGHLLSQRAIVLSYPSSDR